MPNADIYFRAFMENHLPTLKEKNPQLEVLAELSRGQHPFLKGLYKNKNERVVCVKNLTPEEISLQATRLRNALGRKVIKLRTRHVTKHPSVQGTWKDTLKITCCNLLFVAYGNDKQGPFGCRSVPQNVLLGI